MNINRTNNLGFGLFGRSKQPVTPQPTPQELQLARIRQGELDFALGVAKDIKYLLPETAQIPKSEAVISNPDILDPINLTVKPALIVLQDRINDAVVRQDVQTYQSIQPAYNDICASTQNYLYELGGKHYDHENNCGRPEFFALHSAGNKFHNALLPNNINMQVQELLKKYLENKIISAPLIYL